MTLPDLAMLKRYFAEARDLTQAARTQALIAIDYYDSDQFTREELAALERRGQPPIVINRIKPAINGIVGVTERGRSDPRAWPRQPGGEDAADTATDVLRYIADYNRFKRVKQDCFFDLLVPGSSAALVGVDQDQQITITQIRWEEFFHDPRSRRKDFKDARYLGIAKWMYADDLAGLYPDKSTAIEASIEAAGALAIDPSFQDRPLQGVPGGGPWIDRRQRRLMVVELYLRQGGWTRAVFTGADVLEICDSPYLDHRGRPDCPIEAMSAYVKRDNSRYGAVHDMIGPQNEVNKRRSKALHFLALSRVEAVDVATIGVDVDLVRAEAARPDGVLPVGWRMSPNTVEFAGHMEMLQEAKAEIERMGPNPAVLGRDGLDASGRALLARQQSGLIELANLYGALEDWELRIYRQAWARARQFWRAPQFIRVTDDAGAPKFIGLNQPMLTDGVLGYANAVAEMDVDIEVDSQPEIATVGQEQFSDLMRLIGANPAWANQVPLDAMIELSSIPHKRGVIDLIRVAQQAGQAQAAGAAHIDQAVAAARIAETQSRAQLNTAAGTAKMLNALSEAHEAAGLQAASPVD